MKIPTLTFPFTPLLVAYVNMGVCLLVPVTISVNLPAHCANVLIVSHLYHNNIALVRWECSNGQEQKYTLLLVITTMVICLSIQG